MTPRRRAPLRARPNPGMLSAAEGYADELERVVVRERALGTSPTDNTEAGRMMAWSLQWIAYQRGQVANARAELGSNYDPFSAT